MSSNNLTAQDFEFHDNNSEDEHEHDHLNDNNNNSRSEPISITNTGLGLGSGSSTIGTHSQYRLPTSEKLRGLANRIIFSRYYVLFYFAMMSLSLTTLVISLIATSNHRCPPAAWHILEVVINGLMVIEVSTRWVAYGKKYPMTPLNIIDLALVLFCSITLILVFRNPCGEGTRREEVLDTILLVIRNFVQFLRLGNILRRSGHSLLNPPKPIDLSQARSASFALDLDLDLDDDEAVAERQLSAGLAHGGGGGRRTLVGGGRYQRLPNDVDIEAQDRIGTGISNNAGRENLNEEDEEMWDRLG